MIVKELSKFIVDLSYKDIPKTAVDKAKLCFLDFLGVANRGFHEKSTKIAIESINQLYGIDFDSNFGKSSIIGDDYSNIVNAGFINGISAHALDLDDGHRIAQLHPGCVVFPTALAIAEANNINGKKFIESIVCGYEVAIVLGSLANPYHRNQGFHTTGTIGTFAAGATASKLLNLNLEEIINTLGLCGTQSSGLLESDHHGTMGKQFHVGKAVYNGILATYLAKNSFTGAESIIDGDEGFLKAMAINIFDSNNKEFDFDKYLSSYLNDYIGKFHINDVYFKKYPFCRHLHSSIDGVLNINNKFDFNIVDIEKIIVKTYNIAAEHDNFSPKTREDIKQSLPYAIATAMINNDLDLDIIEKDVYNNLDILNNLNDSNSNSIDNFNNSNNNTNDNSNSNSNDNDVSYFKQIFNKITIEENEEFNKSVPKYRPSKVIIETKNEIYEDFVELPLGESENPLSKEDLLEKFKNLNSGFGIKKLNSIEMGIDNIEDNDMSAFMKIFH